jgi:hypothetical protein
LQNEKERAETAEALDAAKLGARADLLLAPPLDDAAAVDVKDAVVRRLNVSPERICVYPRALRRFLIPEVADGLKAGFLDDTARLWGLEAAAEAADPPCGRLERVLAHWPVAVVGMVPSARSATPSLKLAGGSARAVAALERLGWRVVPAPPDGAGRLRAKGRG